jgi:hypothetical protein
MPSTYTLNNGIELIGTGEQSGTWGDTTNTNLGLLDAALDGQVTITLAAAGSSGSPNALPITDGTTSNGRNRMVVFADGGDLGATAYVQLTPNDAEKIIYIRNSLSGSRSVILFQGTYNASNDYEVPAGTTAVVYFDGAGAGAVAANVFNNAHFDALNVVGSVTVGGGVTVTGTVDAGTVEFDNLSGTGAVSVTNILDEDNMASDSATALSTQQSIKAYVDAQVGAFDSLAEVLAVGNTTGGTDLLVSTGDDITFADNSKAIFGAGSDLQIYHDGTDSYVDDQGTGDLRLCGDNLGLMNAAHTEFYLYATTNGAVDIKHNNITKISTTATGIDVTGTVAAAAGTALLPSITTTGDLNTGMWFPAADTIAFSEGGVEALRIDSSGNVGIGTTSPVSNLDVKGSNSRIRWDLGNAYTYQGATNSAGSAFAAAYYDGSEHRWLIASSTKAMIDSSGNVGIGTSSIASGGAGTTNLNVHTPSATSVYLKLSNTGTGNTASDGFDLVADSSGNAYIINRENAPLLFFTNNAERMRIDSSGNVGIGTTSPTGKFHVVGGRSNFAPNSENFAVYLQYNSATSGFYVGSPSADAMAFSASSGAERMRIDSSGNLLVGTTSTIPFLLSSGTGAGITSAGTVMAGATAEAGLFNRIGSDGSIVNFYRAGAIVGSIGSNSGYLYVGGTAGDDAFLSFGADGVRPATSAGAARDAAIDLGGSTNRFKDLYLSGGVYLGGTVAANHLDDYEEGTFTPSWNGSVTAGTASGTFDGTYTKIGRVVYCTINLSACNLTGASGALQITGLPFSAASGHVKSGGTAYLEGITPSFSNTPQTGSHVQLYVSFGTTTAQFRVGLSAQWDNYLSAGSTFTSGGGSTYGIVSITYIT